MQSQSRVVNLMNNKWIIEVLGDVATFAQQNNLPNSYETLLNAMIDISAEVTEQSLQTETVNSSNSENIIRPTAFHN